LAYGGQLAPAEAVAWPPLRYVAATSAVTRPVAPSAHPVTSVPDHRPVPDAVVHEMTSPLCRQPLQSPDALSSLTPAGTVTVSWTSPAVPSARASTPMVVASRAPEIARPTWRGVVATVVVGLAVAGRAGFAVGVGR
jgi:hypothetical protein